MSYYKTLLAVFVIMMASVIVQGSQLFTDIFFVITYAVTAFVLVIGTKFENKSATSLFLGLVLILSVGFLSTLVLMEFFTSVPTVNVMFKLAIVLSLDTCALFFLYYGRKLKGLEGAKQGLGQHEAYKEQILK
jgi:hypothetical protein